jgi:VWFA-related protein
MHFPFASRPSRFVCPACNAQKLDLNILPVRGSIKSERISLYLRFREDSEKMRTRRFRRCVLAWLSLLLLCPYGELPALAQSKRKEPPAPPPQQAPGGFSIAVTVPVVTVDVVVTDNNGNYLTGLKKENFRITEDGNVQTITNFAATDAPITIVLLLEFSKLGYEVFTYNARNWAAAFLGRLKPADWVALETFNMRSNVDVDFTHDGREVMQGLTELVFPPFSESNLFDAVSDVLDRMKDVKGRKAVLVLASGIDTFSRMTLDQTMKRIKETDATIFTVGVGAQMFMAMDISGGAGSTANLTALQAENQLKTFAALTGGRSWSPRFDGEIPSIMQDVAASLRNQYNMAYSPSNQTQDGKYHKIKVELVAQDGGPLTVTNEKGKKVKFQVYARQGYTAPTSNVLGN